MIAPRDLCLNRSCTARMVQRVRKETYYMSKETYYSQKRPAICQKRPTIMSKETYYKCSHPSLYQEILALTASVGAVEAILADAKQLAITTYLGVCVCVCVCACVCVYV